MLDALQLAAGQAWEALRMRPVRAALIVAEVAWGIVCISILLAYGAGFGRALDFGVRSFGNNMFVLWPGQTSQQAGGERTGVRIRFRPGDARRIVQQSSLVRAASPELVTPVKVASEIAAVSATMRAVWPAYGPIRSEIASEGRWLDQADEVQRRRVVFLGEKIRRTLFGGEDAVGRHLRIDGRRFLVVGTMPKKLAVSNYMAPDDRCLWIPYSTAAALVDTRHPTVLVVQARSDSVYQQALLQARTVLGREDHFSPTDHAAAPGYGSHDVRKITNGLAGGLTILLGFIGAITLAIGGVGLMNLMLVSVNERVREIGIRKALGASRRQILWQFLLEAWAMIAAAGVTGAVVAQLACRAIGTVPLLGPIYADSSGRGDIHLRVNGASLLAAFLILGAVGLLSAYAPARRAARLDPIEALRTE